MEPYVGMKTVEYVPPEQKDNFIKEREFFQRALEGEKHRSEFKYDFPNGETIFFEIYWIPFVKKDEIIGVWEITRNVSPMRTRDVKLRQTELKFQSIVENANEAIFVIQDEKIKYFNTRAIEWGGYSEEELLSASFINFIHPDDRDLAMRKYQERTSGEMTSDSYTIRMLKKSNEVKWIIVNSAKVDWEGNPAVVTLLTDITEQIKKEEALRKSDERYKSFIKNSSEGIFCFDCEPPIDISLSPDEQIELIYKSALISEVNDTLARDYGYEKGEELIGMPVEKILPRANPESILLLKELIAENFSSVDKESVELNKFGKKLYFINNTVGIIKNGLLERVWGASTNITKIKETEQKMIQTEQRYRTVADYTYDWEYWELPDGSMEYVSPSCERITGYKQEDFINNPDLFMEIILPEYREEWLNSPKDMLFEKLPIEMELRLKTKSGNSAWIEHIGHQIFNESGQYLGYRASNRDINFRKEVERELRIKESAIDSSLNGIGISDMDGKIVYVNKALVDMWGYEHGDEILGRLLPDFWEGESVFDTIEALKKKGFHQGGDIGKRKDGSLFDAQFSASIIKDEDGSPLYMFVSFVDITDQKQAEEAIRISEARLKEAQQMANIGSWDWNILTNDLYWSDEIYRIFGLAHGDFFADYDAFLDRIHPDDRGAVAHAVDEALKGKKPYSIDHRIILPEGSERIVHEQGVVTYDENGEPVRLFGTVQDITESQELLAALKEQEKELLESQIDLRKLAGKLLTIQEEERRRLARELHDDLTQRLAVLSIDAGKLEMDPACSSEAVSILHNIKKGLIKLSEDIHSISRQLHPSIIEDLGLEDALISEINNTSRREGIPIKFEAKLGSVIIPNDVSLCLFRITQESLRNVMKHSQAESAIVKLVVENDLVILTILDDGRGFDSEEVKKIPGLGLKSMRERVRLVGGSILYTSKPGQGTKVEVRANISS